MSPLDHQLAREIFERAADLPAGERERFLHDRCGGDGELLAHVRRLLDADVEATRFLETPAVAAPAAAPADLAGRRIGKFALGRLLGAGGMGRVYEATQDHPRRKVAVKVISALPSPEALRRFRYEAQLLGRLRHPAIAQVYDAGSYTDPTTGEDIPYFAMEYVEGATPVTEYASAVGWRRRVELFIEFCEGVQHAHQRGVIHRDIKPANLVVDSSGQAKIIDFGVARAAREESDSLTHPITQAGQLIGTLSYMSPEQCGPDARDVDVRTDVYSLGVVLYQVLSGRMPYDVSSGSTLAVARMIREQPPARLRGTGAPFGPDLESVVLRALEKERDRRYQSAGDLAADLRHVLAGEPVSARAPTLWSQLRSLARRNRPTVLAAGAVLAALVLGVVGTTTGLVRAMIARDAALESKLIADLQARRSGQIADYMAEVLASADPYDLKEFARFSEPESILNTGQRRASFAGRPGFGASANDLLIYASQQLDSAMPADPEVRAQVAANLGQIMAKVGLLLESRALLRSAYDTRVRVLGTQNLETARTGEWLAFVQDQFSPRHAECVQLREAAVAARKALQGESHPETVRSEAALGLAMVKFGERARGIAVLRGLVGRIRAASGGTSRAGLEARLTLAEALIAAEDFEAARREAADAINDARLSAGGKDDELALRGRFLRASAANALCMLDEAESESRAVHEAATQRLGAGNAAMLLFNRLRYDVLSSRRRWAEAVELARRMHRQSIVINGVEHHLTYKLTHGLAWTLMRANQDLELAQALCEQAIESTEKFGEPVRADRYRLTLAAIRRLRGDAAGSEALLAAVETRVPGFAAPEHPQCYGTIAFERGMLAAGTPRARELLCESRALFMGVPRNTRWSQTYLAEDVDEALAAMGQPGC